MTLNFEGFVYGPQRAQTGRVENIQDIKTYTGSFSGATTPNKMVPTNEIGVTEVSKGREYKFTFPNDKPYYIEVKMRKLRTVKDSNNMDAYMASLKESRAFKTYYTDEYYHSTVGFGSGAGVARPLPEAPPTQRGNVYVRHITIKNDKVVDLQPQSAVKEDAPIGEEYTTSQGEFEGYHFVRLAGNSAPAEGTVSENDQTVIYVYEPDPTGTVVVTYEDDKGNAIPDNPPVTVKEDSPVGERYETTPSKIPGYVYVKIKESSAPPSGDVVEGTTTVTYVYKKIGGDVDVKYVTTDGTELEGVTTVKDDAPVGEAYTTEKKQFDGYRFKEMGEGSAPAEGEVTEEVQHVVYVYEPDPTGTVVVTYEDDKGNAIPGNPPVTVKEDSPVGERYETTPPKIPGYVYVKIKESSAPPSGDVVEGTTTVTYVYKKIGGDVDVKYVTTDGTELEGVTTVKDDAPVGEAYTTEKKQFDGYRFKEMGEGSAPAEGTVTEEVQHVVYVYELIPAEPTPSEPGTPAEPGQPVDPEDPSPEEPTGTVVVTYEDDKGNAIPGNPPVTVKEDSPVGERYETTPPKIPGYVYVKVKESSAPPSGDVVEGTTTVTYVYKKIGGDVDVKYVTTDGTELEGVTTVKDDAPVGEAYTTEKKQFDGYRFKEMGEGSAPAEGTVTEEVQHVVYVYELIPAEPTPSEPGTPAEPGQPGQPGESSEPSTPSEPVEPTGTVVVTYEDDKGNNIPDYPPVTVKENSPIGEKYKATPPTIPGYEFVKVKNGSTPPEGEVTEGKKVVTFVYKKIVENPANNGHGTVSASPKTGDINTNIHFVMLLLASFSVFVVGIVFILRNKRKFHAR